MACKKRPDIVEYTPPTCSLPTGTITSHHTHYESRHRPVKSTVTVEGHIVTNTPLELDNLVSPIPPPMFLDEDGMEELECQGQELEVLGLPVYHESEAIHSVEGTQKRRRTQAVGNQSRSRDGLTFSRTTLSLAGLNTSTGI